MNLEIKEIFRNTINPNFDLRSKSEEKLAQLQKNYDFLVSLPNTYMKDSDSIIKKTSSLFFKNAVINEWSKSEFESSKKFIISNLVNFYTGTDDISLVAYNGILINFYNREDKKLVHDFIYSVANMLKSNEILHINMALIILEQVYNAEKIKYQLEDILTLIFNTSGKELLTILHSSVQRRDYKMTKIILKLISKSYNYYSIPEFLTKVDVFSFYINITLEILKMNNNEDLNFLNTKKWAAYFLYKASNKGIKRFYKNEEMSTFVMVPERFKYIYEVFLAQLKMEKPRIKFEAVEIYTIEFLTLCASDKKTYEIMEKDLVFLITDYILSLHKLSDSEIDDFENEAEKFLREKYHFFGYNVRNESGTLFIEIVKALKHSEMGMNWLYQFFIQNLNNTKKNLTHENISVSYGIYFMMSRITHTLYKSSKANFESILTDYVFFDLKYGNLIIKSQACFFLSFVEEVISVNQSVLDAIVDVMTILRGKHPVLSVDSTLAMNFFVSNKDLTNYISNYIGEIVQSILTLSGSYDIEPLTYLLDNIMVSFSKEIASFAPDLVQSMGNLILSHLSNDQSESDDRVLVISGFLHNVETIINTENYSPELTKILYQNFYNVLEIILKEKKDNFYQEVFNITNCFFYSLKTIDASMWNLFALIINLPIDELSLFPCEISEIIDNIVCNGKEGVLNNYIFEKIITLVCRLCIEDDDCLYDEDYIAGCKIVETLLLNVGDKIFSLYPDKLDVFVKLVSDGLPKMDDSRSAIIYGLEVIMNCFYIKPLETWHIMKMRNFDTVFFNTLCSKRKEFFRVHDKKICLRFFGKLFQLNSSYVQVNFDIKQLAKCFSTVFCTLPEAIEARNKLMLQPDNNQDYESSEEDEERDDSDEYNDLEEDIYFSTVLDKFDPFPYLYNIIASSEQNNIGSLVLSTMSKEQMDAIQDVFTNKSQIQQKY